LRPARSDLTAAALVSLAAAITITAAQLSEPLEHGIWLIAYLALVGFLAQLLLGRGEVALLFATDLPLPPCEIRVAQALLWNLGVIAVPLGVLVETRLAVVLGSVSLLTALASFWKTVRPAIKTSRCWKRQGVSYVALLVFMAASVVAGVALAWDTPWV